MGMRQSDARWVTRDLLPFLDGLAGLRPAVPLEPASAIDEFATTASLLANEARGRINVAEGRICEQSCLRPAGHGSRNPSIDVFEVWRHDKQVMGLEVVHVPCVVHDDGCTEQAYPPVKLDHNDGNYVYALDWDGDWRWELTIHNAHGQGFTWEFTSRAEVEHAATLAADALAIGAGFTCHGGRPTSPYGVLTWFPETNPGEQPTQSAR
jgi:hypothetical protein